MKKLTRKINRGRCPYCKRINSVYGSSGQRDATHCEHLAAWIKNVDANGYFKEYVFYFKGGI